MADNDLIRRLRDHENEGVTHSDRFHLREEAATALERHAVPLPGSESSYPEIPDTSSNSVGAPSTEATHAAVRPCPFCGGLNIGVHEGSTFRWRYARCDECGAQAGEVRVNTTKNDRQQAEQEAVQSAMVEWNTRAVVGHAVPREPSEPMIAAAQVLVMAASFPGAKAPLLKDLWQAMYDAAVVPANPRPEPEVIPTQSMREFAGRVQARTDAHQAGVSGGTECAHEWVSADNEVVSGAAICLKCKTVAGLQYAKDHQTGVSGGKAESEQTPQPAKDATGADRCSICYGPYLACECCTTA